MARPLRIEYPGAVYHVTARGNERKAIFRADQDREAFLDTLHQVTLRYHWLCHAYCLMENHYHLVIETPEGNLSLGMRQLNGVYTQWFNRRHRRVGHLFQGRFKAVVIQKESHLLEVCRYVVLNPLRAKAADHPARWFWSSYGATAGMTRTHPSLTMDWILSQFAPQKAKAQADYRKFVRDGIKSGSIWHKLKAKSLLGEEEFVKHFVDHVRGKERIADIPKSQRFIARPTLNHLFGDIAFKDRQVRNCRILEAVQQHGYTQKELADYLGLHFTSVSRLLRNKTIVPRK